MSAASFYNQDQDQSRGYPQKAYPPPPNGYDQQAQYQSQNGYQQQNYAPPPPQHAYPQQAYQAPPPPKNYGMKPSAPYAPPQQQPQESYSGNGSGVEANNDGKQPYDTAPFSQANEKTGQRLNPRKRLNDPIPLVLFLASFVGFIVLAAIAISAFVEVGGLGGGLGSAASGETGTSITLDL
jgi:hypothetical protein